MTILVVDDHAMFADCVVSILSRKFEIKSVASGSDALAEISSSHLTLVLLDYNLPDIDGITLLKVIKSLPCPPAILLLSGETSYGLINTARQAGANGFLHKSLSADVLTDAVEKINLGESVWPDFGELTPSGNNSDQDITVCWNQDIARKIGVTERQLDVLQLITQGLSNKAIARELNIAESTVKTHVKSLFRLLKASNRVDCFYRARNLGLVREKYLVADH